MEIFWLFKLYIKKEKKVLVYHNTQQSLGFVVKLKNKKTCEIAMQYWYIMYSL